MFNLLPLPNGRGNNLSLAPWDSRNNLITSELLCLYNNETATKRLLGLGLWEKAPSSLTLS